jgi:endonuclease/exonuclease/phosphatase (EEP) superfamily protein YafD
VLFAAEFVTLAPYLIGNDLKADTTDAGAKLRVLQFNVSQQNQDWQNFAEWIRPRVDSFDIIVLLENAPSWAAVIQGLSREFPAHMQLSRTDSYGIAVFSRLPGSRFTPRYLGTDRLPAVELTASLGGRPFTAIAAHTYAPIGRIMSDGRNAQLQDLAKWIMMAPPGHKVLLGDLNLTPFSPWFRDLLEATNLSDAQNGLGLLPTWAPNVFPTSFGLPIDHTLISDTLSVSYRTCNERFGSDHCAVIAELTGNPGAQEDNRTKAIQSDGSS